MKNQIKNSINIKNVVLVLNKERNTYCIFDRTKKNPSIFNKSDFPFSFGAVLEEYQKLSTDRTREVYWNMEFSNIFFSLFLRSEREDNEFYINMRNEFESSVFS